MTEKIAETSTLVAVRDCFTYSRTMVQASCVTGPAGGGKTTALHWLSQNEPATTLVHVEEHCNTERSFAVLLADHMDFYVDKKSAWQIMDVIQCHIQHPAARAALFMFDEAQNIPVGSLKTVASWPERFGVPVLFCGNDKLLKRTRGGDAGFDQIESRIAKWVRLEKPVREDFEAIASRFGVFGVDAKNACASYGKEKSLRDLVTMLEGASGFAAGEHITIDDIRKAVVYKEGHHGLTKLSPKRGRANAWEKEEGLV